MAKLYRKDLKYNGSIVRYLDDNDEEYDVCCANSEIIRGGAIHKYEWTTQGYKKTYSFNEVF